MKHHIRKLLVSCGLSLALGAALAAQDLGDLAKHAGNMGNMGSLAGLTQKLHLSPQQLQQVLPILQAEVPKLQGILGKTGLTDKQKVAETKTVTNQSDSQLKNILSPEQLTSLKGFRSEQLKDILQGVVPQ
jgi:hypothetical protein